MSGITPYESTEDLGSYRFHQLKHRLFQRSKPDKENKASDSPPKKSRWRTLVGLFARRKKITRWKPLQTVIEFIIQYVNQFIPVDIRQSGIKWAPLHVPLSRRLETLATAFYTIHGTIIPICSYAILYYILYSQLWWLGLIYTMYLINDYQITTHGSRRSNWYRNLSIWRYVAQYFPIRIIKTAELDPSKNYLAPFCPHGQLMMGASITFQTNGAGFDSTFPGIYSYIAQVPSKLTAPFLRDVNLFGGAVAKSEEGISYVLDKKRHKGNLLAINLGGSSEAIVASRDVYHVIIKNRTAYARIALKTGASLVPVFVFGETRMYKTERWRCPEATWMKTLQDKIRELTGIAPVAIRGRGFFQYSFGILPFRTPVFVVVGEPIHVRQNFDPSKQEIDALHEKYMLKLVELYETNKHKYEPNPKMPLVLM